MVCTSFSTYAPDTSALPYDHHMLMALVAPRALLVIENSGIDYLGPISTYGCSIATRMVYESLGAEESMGVSQAAHGNSHCQMPSSQNPEVAAFYTKFLLGKTADTNVVKTDGKFNWVASQWIDWVLRKLSWERTTNGERIQFCQTMLLIRYILMSLIFTT